MIAEGGKVTGQGQIIRADGTVIDIVITGDALTKEQAEQFSNAIEDKQNGNNTR